jgi:hypothetical protein
MAIIGKLQLQYCVNKKKTFAQGSHGVRVEQVQPDSLRHGQPAAENRAGLQVQHLLPGPDRQERHAGVLSREYAAH